MILPTTLSVGALIHVTVQKIQGWKEFPPMDAYGSHELKDKDNNTFFFFILNINSLPTQD